MKNDYTHVRHVSPKQRSSHRKYQPKIKYAILNLDNDDVLFCRFRNKEKTLQCKPNDVVSRN